MQQQAHLGGVKEMAQVLGISRSGYYRYCQAKQSQRQEANDRLMKDINSIHQQSRQTYVSPRVHAELKTQGYSCSRPRVARLMQQQGIAAKMKKRFKKTTCVNPKAPVAANVLQQDFSAKRPNERWLSDITYISTNEGWLYVAVLLDLFSRKVVGMATSESLEKELVIQALKQALGRRQRQGELLHHSDKGCQYTSKAFRDLLNQENIRCSMSGTGNCFDNAAMESFFHTLKTEHVYFERYQTRKEAQASIFEYVEVFYNNQRRHSTLDYLAPTEFENNYYQQQKISF